MNGDGYADVIVGGYGFFDRVYIYSGGPIMDNIPDVMMATQATDDGFGKSVSTAGDVNGDGYADVIVGAYVYSGSIGRAYIFFGGSIMDNTADVIMTGESINNNFGTSVSTAGDMNGDGYADVIVGADGYSTGTGRAYIYLSSSPPIIPRIASIKDVPFDQGRTCQGCVGTGADTTYKEQVGLQNMSSNEVILRGRQVLCGTMSQLYPHFASRSIPM